MKPLLFIQYVLELREFVQILRKKGKKSQSQIGIR